MSNIQKLFNINFINKLIENMVESESFTPHPFSRINPQGKSFYLKTKVDDKDVTIRCRMDNIGRRHIGFYVDKEWVTPWHDQELAYIAKELKVFCWKFYAPEEARLPC